jgi:phosphoribosylanthranilate isomerase
MHTKPKVKICGIKNEAEVNIINQFPVNYIGFIFAKSKRQIDIKSAISLKAALKPGIKTVGVFVDEPVDYIIKALKDCGLSSVQLHGNETEDLEKTKFLCHYREKEGLTFEIFKSISVKDKNSLHIIPIFAEYVDYILLDAYSNGQTGGTGKIFNWDLVGDLSKSYPIILAGGLNPDNIIEAIRRVSPYMIDVNSGVETSLMKDEEKIKKLFIALKEEL